MPFLQQNLHAAFAAADIIISRAGAGAIFEIAATGKPAILIPITESANDHQRENAFQYEKAGACVVISEENLFGDLVIREINNILQNPGKLKKMRENAKTFYRPDAAEIIARDIINIGTTA